MSEAKTRADLERLANSSRFTTQIDPRDKLHHWLGCALHRNPYDAAPPEVRAAIEAAIERTKGT